MWGEMVFDFKCISGCAECCIWRGYYENPNSIALDRKTSKQISAAEYFLGKLGVEILPFEVRRIRKLAEKLRGRVDDVGLEIQYRIFPCTAVTPKGQNKAPSIPDTFQIMGYNVDGDYCPFLSNKNDNVKPNL